MRPEKLFLLDIVEATYAIKRFCEPIEEYEFRMLIDAIKNTGAVVMGKHAYEMANDPDWYAGNYEFQTPIFLQTHTTPEKHPKETEKLTFTFVTDGIENAIAQAKAAAGEKDVQVIGGASSFFSEDQ